MSEHLLKKLISPQIDEDLLNRLSTSIDATFDPSYWVLTELGIDLFDNQIEILEKVVDLNVKYLSLIAARSSGKSFGVGTGLVKICVENPGIQIGVFGPKAAQAIRLLDEIQNKIMHVRNREKYLDKNKLTKSYIPFLNGSSIQAQSAAEETEGEGFHYDIVVIDESQRVSSFSYGQRIAPMVSSSAIGKIIHLGVPLYKGHFWKSFQNPQFTKLIFDWRKCPKLEQGGVYVIDGVSYPKTVVEQMPRSIKQIYFPNRSDLWFDSMTGMSEEDFYTQYEMRWLDNLSSVLNDEDQIRLNSGNHAILTAGVAHEMYYFGLDFAGGKVVGDKEKSDFTALSIWRKTVGNVKEKVFTTEWKGDLSNQLGDILSIIHPQTGLFKCVAGVADYGNMGGGLVDVMVQQGIPIVGLYFHSREPNSGKNYKNAMTDHFVFELRNDRIKYPSIVNMAKASIASHFDPNVKIMRKHFNEWCMLEKHVKSAGINAEIRAPDEEHDDGAFSDIMAIFAADGKIQANNQHSTYRIPGGVKVNSVLGKGLGGGVAGMSLIKKRSIFGGL
jgi:hypothetical protein